MPKMMKITLYTTQKVSPEDLKSMNDTYPSLRKPETVTLCSDAGSG